MKALNVLETIGNTPHIRLSRLFPDATVWIKSERANPGGSIKDRIAPWPWWRLPFAATCFQPSSSAIGSAAG